MSDLAQLLRDAMTEHTDGIEPPTDVARVALDRAGRHTRHGHLAPIAVGIVVIAIVLSGLVVHLARGGSGSVGLSTTNSAPGPIRCDTPTRSVPGYLSWPCNAETVSGYYQTGFHDMLEGAPQAFGFAHQVPGGLRMRVLAYGSVPGVAGRFAFIAAEFWRPDHGRARVAYSEFAGPTGPYVVGGATNLRAVVFNTGDVVPNAGFTAAACAGSSPTHEAATPHCTGIFLVRPGIASLRLIRPGLAADTVPVRHGVCWTARHELRACAPSRLAGAGARRSGACHCIGELRQRHLRRGRGAWRDRRCARSWPCGR
jgi:hypothetical protein